MSGVRKRKTEVDKLSIFYVYVSRCYIVSNGLLNSRP